MQRPVVSHFFAKPSQSPKGKASPRQPSIITLSDSEDGGSIQDEDELRVVGNRSSGVGAKKRKSPPALTREGNHDGEKKVKMAPLFERAKDTQISDKKEKEASGEAAKKLQRWKFAPSESLAQPPITGESSPGLPDLPGMSKHFSKSLETQRAEVRRKLLGGATRVRQYSIENDEGESMHSMNQDEEMQDRDAEEEETVPFASTSYSKIPSKDKGKAEEKTAPVAMVGSRFSKFVARSKGTSTVKGKKSNIAANLNAKDATLKYTPLEQQVLDIKAENVSRGCIGCHIYIAAAAKSLNRLSRILSSLSKSATNTNSLERMPKSPLGSSTLLASCRSTFTLL